MVTIRRQITRDEDRYGSFAAEAESPVPAATEREFNDDLLRMRSYSDTVTDVPVKSERTTAVEEPEAEREVRKAPAPVEYERKLEAPVRRKSIGEVMPDIIHRNRVEHTVETETVSVPKEKKLTASAKRAIAIYMSVILAIVIGIIVTGVVVSGMAADISAYESRIEQQYETIADQTAALRVNEAEIKEKAEQLGMVEIDSSEIKHFENLGLSGNTDDTSGIFDSVRDWLNSIIGG